MSDEIKSTCCNAEVKVEGVGDYIYFGKVCTQYYVCKKCKNPCDVDEGNVIQKLNKEFDEDIRFLRSHCFVNCDRVTNPTGQCSCKQFDKGIQQFLNKAIRRVLESVDVEGCGNKNCKRTHDHKYLLGRSDVKDELLKQIDELNK